MENLTFSAVSHTRVRVNIHSIYSLETGAICESYLTVTGLEHKTS